METLYRFNAFHGMLCSPGDAAKCISDLSGGILFMPSDYKKKGVRNYLCGTLNLWTYYGLVVSSFTGLSTLLSLTETIAVEENFTDGLSCPEIENDPDIYDALMSSECTGRTHPKVVRMFSYRFVLPMINVKMFHIIDDDKPEKLHLVEIYQKENRLNSIYAFGTFLVASYLTTIVKK